jgi:hypothetical protein
MATRSIVTSQPDVACDVCGRRLLRGEHADLFLAAGRRRTVCELCAPRAAHEGWLREEDRHSASVAPARSRRGRNLLGRLRQIRESDGDFAPEQRELELPLGGVEPAGSYDFLDPFVGDVAEEPAVAQVQEPALPTGGEVKIERALEVFNAGEYPRRVAGVARSLGEPGVAVRPVADSGSVVAIVVAWELCWYRYEVDLGDEAAGARVAAQGTELGELEHEDRLVNATADEHGVLSRVGV